MNKEENIEERAETVIRKMKESGCRITMQRRMLIQIILENECSSCKEIYFAAKERDRKVGIATVYRMVQLLEDMELIHKEMVIRM